MRPLHLVTGLAGAAGLLGATIVLLGAESPRSAPAISSPPSPRSSTSAPLAAASAPPIARSQEPGRAELNPQRHAGLPELDAALEAARAAEARDDEAAEGEARRQRQLLVQRLLVDPRALQLALEAFRGAGAEEAEVLAATLGQVRDLAVEEAALELAASGASAELRAAAFDVLDALDSARGLEVALTASARETDPRVRRAALFALPEPRGATRESARRVVQELSPRLSGDPDPEARRRVALALAPWHTSGEELEPLLLALARDPDASVRAGVAFALERCGRRDPRVAAALADVLRRPDEERQVRENAWHALGAQGPLGPREAAAFADYAGAREGWLEGED